MKKATAKITKSLTEYTSPLNDHSLIAPDVVTENVSIK